MIVQKRAICPMLQGITFGYQCDKDGGRIVRRGSQHTRLSPSKLNKSETNGYTETVVWKAAKQKYINK